MSELSIFEVHIELEEKDTLGIRFNEDLVNLFDSREDFLSNVDMEKLKEVIFPLGNAIIKQAKEKLCNE